ncbi:MAG: GIY-YIG nuclease family protein [Cellvibrionaceae bacterium]|nr:GIY-YIG nuclease family protein [Cellvibrionaceae bacterium]
MLTLWSVYILECADGSFYTGVTTDIDRRIIEHNNNTGRGARYTRGRGPVKLSYIEPQESQSCACKREAQIKRLKRKQKKQLIARQANEPA